MTKYAVFGATSAIAEHTARSLVAPGDRFFLVARQSEKMERIAADLRVRGAAHVSTVTYDFSYLDGITQLVDQATSDLGAIDQALIAFGTLTDQANAEKSGDYSAKEITINFTSPALLAQSVANHMKANGKGLIAIITSVAGDRGRSSNYVYGSAKGGLQLFAQGLRHKLAASGIEVLDIRPGFVDTPMTRDFRKGPLWAKPSAVGASIAKAMRENKGGRLYVPFFWAFIMLIIRSVPTALFHKTKL
jgi:short-subunit dehydrogenase